MRTATVIIGGGQAGLAMSRCLSDRGIEHVVLERGEIANRWRTHGWNSLRLLTPNWMTRLPGARYEGHEPDGFMTVAELVAFLQQYASSSRVPLVTKAAVREVTLRNDAFQVSTDRGTWCASAVVIATGHCDEPLVPEIHRELPAGTAQIVPRDYRTPEQLPPGGVLIVGASSTGIQLAEEIHTAGREVTIAVGQHTRLPRTYRGRDILWWLDRLGVLDQDARSVYDLDVSREQPSLQLVGRRDRATLDLGVLHARGVRVVGRLRGFCHTRAQFSDDLIATTAAADFKLASVLMRIEQYVREAGLGAADAPPFEPLWPVFRESATEIDLQSAGIRTVIWATGYRRAYPWLRVPVLDRQGEIVHRGGVTALPGLYVLGLNFLRRRNSSFIDGVGADARELSDHLARHIGAVCHA